MQSRPGEDEKKKKKKKEGRPKPEDKKSMHPRSNLADPASRVRPRRSWRHIKSTLRS